MMHGGLRLESWRSSLVEICASKAALCATGRPRTAADTNAVHDRLLQSMRVRFSDSEQWSSPVKPPRSQNYVKPHDARMRVHVPGNSAFRNNGRDRGCGCDGILSAAVFT